MGWEVTMRRLSTLLLALALSGPVEAKSVKGAVNGGKVKVKSGAVKVKGGAVKAKAKVKGAVH
jgi:hypothetical protein